MSAPTTDISLPQARLRYWQTLSLLQASVLAVIVLFLARPDIDLAVAGWAAGAGNAFPLESDPRTVAIRDAFRALFWVVAGIVVVFIAIGAVLGRAARVPRRIWWFLAAAMALGPGLLVNGILKNVVGRPRPFHIDAFGGPHPFALPFQVTDACARNCSFVSGEAAAIGTLGIAFGALIWNGRCRLRQLAVLALVPPVVLAGGLRVAMGRHFLSDVVLAWLFCALVVAILYGLFRIGPLRHRLTPANLAADLRAVLGRRRGRTPSERAA